MYKLISKEALTQAILDNFSFSCRLNMEIIEVVWSSAIETSAYNDEEFTNIEILNKIKNIIMSRNEKGVG